MKEFGKFVSEIKMKNAREQDYEGAAAWRNVERVILSGKNLSTNILLEIKFHLSADIDIRLVNIKQRYCE
jgi:hypothetical protein